MTAFAQTLAVRNTIADITIAPFNSPEFAAAVSSLGDTARDQLSALGEAAPYVSAIRNNGRETIAMISVVYEVDNGKEIIKRACAPQKLAFAPGQVILTNPCPLRPPVSQQVGQVTNSKKAQDDAAFFRGKSVTAVIDSVLYEDGGFAGPDKLQQFDNIIQRDKAIQNFFESLAGFQGKSADSLREWLVAQSQQELRSKGIDNLDLATLAVRLEARATLLILNQLGDGSVFQRAERESKSSRAKPLVYRR